MFRIMRVDELPERERFSLGYEIDVEVRDGFASRLKIDKPRIGSLEFIVVCDRTGKPLYDTVQIEEGPRKEDGTRDLFSGSIVVPYTFETEKNVNVGLIEIVRPIVKDPKTGMQGSYVSLEIPRGLSDLGETPEKTAVRELGEETGKHALSIHYIGRQNPNTASYTSPGIRVYAVEIDPAIASAPKEDSHEKILKCNFFPYREVKKMVSDGKIICGMTLSGLMLFDTFLEKI